MRKVFVVEDDDLARELYCQLLDLLGYNVIGCAANGEEAISMFRNFPVKPDLILMDYRLPLKNGLDAMKEILHQDGTSKVIFASADNNIKQEALKAGAMCFIEKPFNFKKLQEEMNRILANK